jgi:hypothetical protein
VKPAPLGKPAARSPAHCPEQGLPVALWRCVSPCPCCAPHTPTNGTVYPPACWYHSAMSYRAQFIAGTEGLCPLPPR